MWPVAGLLLNQPKRQPARWPLGKLAVGPSVSLLPIRLGTVKRSRGGPWKFVNLKRPGNQQIRASPSACVLFIQITQRRVSGACWTIRHGVHYGPPVIPFVARVLFCVTSERFSPSGSRFCFVVFESDSTLGFSAAAQVPDVCKQYMSATGSSRGLQERKKKRLPFKKCVHFPSLIR